MDVRKTAAVYAAVVAVGMLGMWTALLAAGEVTELDDAPLEVAYHLAAETATAVLLLAASGGLLRMKPWGSPVFFVAMGMLLYTVIVSAGYYAERGDGVMVAMFILLTLSTVAVVALAVRRGFVSS